MTQPDRPRFSIVVPTHNRTAMLQALLESLRRHPNPHLDSVVVVDDSDHFQDLSDRYADLNLKHLRLKERVFISRAKNLGWRACSSECIYFIDDDNVVTQGTLERPLRSLWSSPDVGAVMPSVLYKKRPDLVWVYATPISPGAWGHTLVGRNRVRDRGLENRVMDTDALPNASLVRRRALEQINGLNEAFVVNSSADLALRLKRAGWKVVADTGAFILHDVEPPGRMGSWAKHGASDPERVFYEVRDWFLLMRSLHPRQDFFSLRATWHSLGFVLPNGLTYLVSGGLGRRDPLAQLVRGYLEGLRASAHLALPGVIP